MLSPLFFEAKLFTLSPKNQVVLAVHQLMDALNFAGDVDLFDKLESPTVHSEWNLPYIIVSEGGSCFGESQNTDIFTALEQWAQAHPWMHIHVYGYDIGSWILKDGNCYRKMTLSQQRTSFEQYHPSEIQLYKMELEEQLRLIDEVLKHTTPVSPNLPPSTSLCPDPTEVIRFFEQHPDERVQYLFSNFTDTPSDLTPYTLNKAHWQKIEQDFGLHNRFVQWFTQQFDNTIDSYFLCTDFFKDRWNECHDAVQFAQQFEQKIRKEILSFNDQHRQSVLSPTPLVHSMDDIPTPPNIETLKSILFSEDHAAVQQGLELLKAVSTLESILHFCERDVLGRFRFPQPNAHLAHALLQTIHSGESPRLSQLLQQGMLSSIAMQAADLLDWNALTESEKWVLGTELYKTVLIPAGTYWRGAYTLITPHFDTTSHMPHRVQISKPFWCSIYPWTNLQQAQLTEGAIREPFNPLTDVSLYEAIQICNQRSERDGLNPAYTIHKALKIKKRRVRKWPEIEWHKDANGWRLPTSAEWEYMARAYDHRDIPGTDTPNLGAWLDGQVHAVGQLAPNGFGIHDVVGNIGEFCFDRSTHYPHIESLEQPISTLIDPWENIGQEALFRGQKSIAHQEPETMNRFTVPDISTAMSSTGLRMICNFEG